MVSAMAIKQIAVVFCFIVITLTLFTSGMFKPLGHDENMYCAAGALTAQGKLIYRDFSYVTHPPYHALVVAIIYKLLHTTHYLLVGRLVSIICDCLIALFIFLIFLRVLRNAAGVYLGLAAAVLHVFNPYVLYAGGFAWHHSLILLCVIAAFWLYTAGDSQTVPRYWRIAAVAALLTGAVFMRLTCALIWLVFLVFILLERRPLRQKLRYISVFLLASCIVSLCPLYIIAQAPAAFYIDVFTVPFLNIAYPQSIGRSYDKLDLVSRVIIQPTYLLTVLLGAGLWLAAFIRRKNADTTAHRPLILAAVLAAAFFLIALIIPSSWEQYFAMPIPFLILSMAYPLAGFCTAVYSNRIKLTAAAIIFLSLVLNPDPLKLLPAVTLPSQYVPVQIHAIANDIASKVGKENRVLTLAPLFAIEGGCEIYPQLAAGPFAYRIADSMTVRERTAAKAVGPTEIAELAQKNPPSAILLGTEPPQLENPLRAIAPPTWKTQTYLDSQLTLFSN